MPRFSAPSSRGVCVLLRSQCLKMTPSVSEEGTTPPCARKIRRGAMCRNDPIAQSGRHAERGNSRRWMSRALHALLPDDIADVAMEGGRVPEKAEYSARARRRLAANGHDPRSKPAHDRQYSRKRAPGDASVRRRNGTLPRSRHTPDTCHDRRRRVLHSRSQSCRRERATRSTWATPLASRGSDADCLTQVRARSIAAFSVSLPMRHPMHEQKTPPNSVTFYSL
jgi:hypothetical protein